MEKIVAIEEIGEVSKNGWSYVGYSITTNKQVIKLMIDNVQSCCESWGYFMSEDSPDTFVGAELLGITLTDTALNTVDFKKYGVTDPREDCFEGGIMFVNISTNRGTLQFVAYNEHNGYYGHEAYVKSEQLDYKTCL